MKKTFYILIQAALLTTGCCNTPADDPLSRTSDMAGWSIDVVAPGCVWYNYTGFYLPTGANQTINVLEIDLSHGGYSLSVVHSEEADSLSAFALRADAFAGINGSYFEPDVSFVKTDGKVRREVTVDKTHTRYWKQSVYELSGGIGEEQRGADDAQLLRIQRMAVDDRFLHHVERGAADVVKAVTDRPGQKTLEAEPAVEPVPFLRAALQRRNRFAGSVKGFYFVEHGMSCVNRSVSPIPRC